MKALNLPPHFTIAPPANAGGTYVTFTACFFLLLLTLSSWPTTSLADSSPDDDSQKLEQLRQQIQTLRSELNSDVQRQQNVRSRLRRSEQHIGKVVALLKRLKHQLRKQQRELKKLNSRRGGLQSDLHTQRVALARQIRASYAIGQQEYIKILLNQQDPAVVTRTLTYYDYFHRARLARMQDIDESLTELLAVEKKIQHKTVKLQQNRQEQRSEKAQLEKTRQQRATLLAGLKKQILAKGERLSRMEEDKRRLQRLLDSLVSTPRQPFIESDDNTADLTSEGSEHVPFAKLRGRLNWPSHGRLSTLYGSRKVSNLKWQGVNISAPEGTEVRAISHGRVAFSDWFSGFGLLTIIDHGDSYMSLYGGNQSLFKEVGDWVDTGDVIASVGNSGGRQESVLYFEIRHNGKPSNPLKWCRNRPKQVKRTS